jgi:HAD superfamily hydrolase (TIGR01509 family)
MPLEAAVFDFDGVLVDSEPLHFRALRDALRTEGVSITEGEYWSIYLAYDDRGAIRLALEQHGVPVDADRVERLAAAKVERFAALLPEVAVFPGARELVRALAAEVPLAIASGARHEEIVKVLGATGLADAFGVVVGAEDAPRTKPDPAPYAEAARLLRARVPALAPGDCLAIEDSMPGIASARAAGMKVLGVAHSYPAEKLTAAHRVVDSLVGLDPAGFRGLFEA